MRILITGCGGFAGTHLARQILLHTGYWKNARLYAGVYEEREKILLEKALFWEAESCGKEGALERVRFLRADMTKKEQVFSMVQASCPDVVFHLAAQSSVALSFRQPELTMAVNVEGTDNLLEALRQINPKARILLVGSIDQYGCVPEKEQPILETRPLQARSPYGESKLLQERHALDRVEKYGQDILLVRSAPHIGPGQSRTFAVADWAAQIREMQKGLRPRRLLTGNLEIVRDMTDVRDMAAAYMLLLEKGRAGEIYNAGAGAGIRLSDIPPMLSVLGGIEDLKVEKDPDRFRPADIPMLVPDVRKLKFCTGWQPKYRLRDTLQEMLKEPEAAG